MQLRDGDSAAAVRLFPLVYGELRDRAHRQRRGWQGDYTMNSTALVHEAYLKLVDQTQPAAWNGRAHFLAVAARAMRQILIDYAKSRRRQKRGGDQVKVSFEELEGLLEDGGALTEERADTFLALDEALRRLEMTSGRQGRIVECRFFGGMTIEDTAAALDVSPATVKRGWEMARVWLFRELTRQGV
jgi:RNA polymerase sigma factor (TIGR02999 family)